MAIYKVILSYLTLGIECQNVFYYEDPNTAGGAESLANAFVADVFPAIQDMQSGGVVYETLEVIRLDVDDDFYIAAFAAGTIGTLFGETLPAFITFTFKLNRSTRATRSGRKAFSGVTEQSISNGDASSDTLVFLQAAAAAMEDNLVDVNSNTYLPTICRFESGNPVPTVTNPVSTVTYSRVSTQNTRKS